MGRNWKTTNLNTKMDYEYRKVEYTCNNCEVRTLKVFKLFDLLSRFIRCKIVAKYLATVTVSYTHLDVYKRQP